MSVRRIPEPAQSEVLIVGAGFSKAIARAFPITDALGRAAVRLAHVGRLRLPVGGFHGGNFETWLSQLAEDQPHLSEAENYGNRELFARMTEAVVDVLRSREQLAFGEAAPPWLYQLLSVAHQQRFTIISLNYDTIIEVCLNSFGLGAPDDDAGRGNELVTADDVLAFLPPRMGGVAITYGGRPLPALPTFRLLKLHGSLDWYWSSGDLTGTSLRRTTVVSSFGDPQGDPTLRDREVPGLEPFIVPPTGTKSEYFRNPLTRHLWRLASQALKQADRITLLGYSIPPADLAMSSLIANAIKRRDVRIGVADLKTAGPESRLRALGARAVETTSGSRCIERFATNRCDAAANVLVDNLRRSSAPPATALTISWARPAPGQIYGDVPVRGFERLGPDLVVDPCVPGTVASHSGTSHLSALQAQLDERVRRLVVRQPGGRIVPIVGGFQNVPTVADHLAHLDASGELQWMSLVPAGNRSQVSP